MKYLRIILISIILCVIIFLWIKNIKPNNTQASNYQTNQLSASNTTQNTENTTTPEITPTPAPNPEETLATFSTKIYDKSSARQNNINITCNTLNGTIIKANETFSFCNIVGQATSDKGYQKADIFDKYGNKKKGYGGGNCQISTTLYNCVLSIPSLNVTERHPHSNRVPYIEKGKDAAVAYGSYDFKFSNNSNRDIKIYVSSDATNVTATIVGI